MSFVSDQYAAMANDMAQARQNREHHNAQARSQSNYDSLHKNALILIDDKAHVLAQRAALGHYIRTLFQDSSAYIPAMDDPAIWENIGKAGVSAYTHTEDWEAVKEAGRNFRLPEGPDIYKDHVPYVKFLRQNNVLMESIASSVNAEAVISDLSFENAEYEKRIKELENKNAELLETSRQDENLKKSFSTENKRLTKSLAYSLSLAAAFHQHLSAAVPNHPLVTDQELRDLIGKTAYEYFVKTGSKNWDDVVLAGKSILTIEMAQHLMAVAEVKASAEPLMAAAEALLAGEQKKTE